MKGFLSRALATVALTLCALPIAAQTTPTYSDETVISFLGKPTNTIRFEEMTQEALMDLLDENGKKYVESIEWNNIKTMPQTSDPAQIGLQIEYNMSTVGYITLKFKKDVTFNAGRIYLFAANAKITSTNTKVYADAYANFGENDQQVLAMGNAGIRFYFDKQFNSSSSLEKLIDDMKKSSSSIYGSTYSRLIRTPEVEKQFPLRSFTLKVEPTGQRGIAFHGIKILHNGFVENDINTGVEEIAQENGAVEYFDLYGRRLADKPTQGMFIEKRGSKVTKLLAR